MTGHLLWWLQFEHLKIVFLCSNALHLKAWVASECAVMFCCLETFATFTLILIVEFRKFWVKCLILNFGGVVWSLPLKNWASCRLPVRKKISCICKVAEMVPARELAAASAIRTDEMEPIVALMYILRRFLGSWMKTPRPAFLVASPCLSGVVEAST